MVLVESDAPYRLVFTRTGTDFTLTMKDCALLHACVLFNETVCRFLLKSSVVE